MPATSSSAPTPRPASKLGYVRIPNPAHDPQLQIAALTAVGVHAHHIFLDQSPAKSAHRPELTKLLDQIRPHDTLVIWRLDRLGRSTSHLARLVTDLAANNIWFASLTEAIDTSPPEGHPQLQIFAALDECERILQRERSMAGLAAARAQGRRGGRPTVMTHEKLLTARQMLAQGTAKAVIATTIGVSRPTLYAHLQTLNHAP